MKAFGVDIGGTGIQIGLYQTNGDRLLKREIPTDCRDGGANILPTVVQTVNQMITEAHLTPNDILGVGLGVPGPVGDDGTVYKCVNLGWPVVNIVETWGKLSPIPAAVGNDANVAALGEWRYGAGQGAHSLYMLTLGTGIGGALILNGQVVNGSHGAAGEIGHMPYDMSETEPCNCGLFGCMEQTAAIRGVVRAAKAAMREDTGSSLYRVPEITGKAVFDAAKAGDLAANMAVESMVQALAISCARIACVTDPELFILGGGMSRAGDFLRQQVAQWYRRYAVKQAKDTPFVLAKLGNDAGMLGAAELVFSTLPPA